MDNVEVELKSFRASFGESILIKLFDSTNYSNTVRNILIDGGQGNECIIELKKEMKKLADNNEKIDLLILTHIDNDHLSGILNLYGDSKFNPEIIEEVWFNSLNTINNELHSSIDIDASYLKVPIKSKQKGYKHGFSLEEILSNNSSVNTRLIKNGHVKSNLGKDIKIKVLTPSTKALKKLACKWDSYLHKNKSTKKNRMKSLKSDYRYSVNELLEKKFIEDNAVINGSSICILIEAGRKKILMTGDAHPSDIVSGLKGIGYNKINKLQLDLMKLPHHGSKKNTSFDLVEVISCQNYLICTDGSRTHHPDKEALSKYLSTVNETNFLFNYDNVANKKIFSDEELLKYKIKIIKLNKEKNILKYHIK